MVVSGVLGHLLSLPCRLFNKGELLQVLKHVGPSQVLLLAVAVLLVVLVGRVTRLILKHAWYTHHLSCFSRPPTDSWLLGHLGQMRSTEEGLRDVDELVRRYHHSCSWFLGPFYALVRLFHPDYIKPLLLAPASITVKDELFYGFLRPWLGQGLLLSNGEEWSRRRRLLTPAFHFDVLKSYVTIFNQTANTMHAKWSRLVANGENCIEMFHDVSLMTLDSILRCAFSYDSDCQEKSTEYSAAIMELSDLIIERRQKVLHHWDWIYWRSKQGQRFRQACNVVHRMSREVVQQRHAHFDQQRETELRAGKAVDFIDILLLSKDEEGRGLSDQEIEAEVHTFMFAGHDTTASGISWVLYNLALHQDHQDSCRAEAQTLLEGRDTHTIQWDDLSSLPFTTMCIKETLRLHSPVSAVTRKYTEDLVLPAGHTVPKGAICLVSIYGTHHNPDIWPNPDVFEPLRFDPANTGGRSAHAFIPFSSGPRNCIGQKFAMAELKVILALTLLRFRVIPGSDPLTSIESGVTDIRRLPQLVLRAEGGIWLQLEAL
ncbi:cytochrome P450 4F3 [Aplochiton taeniatus]